MARMPSLVAVSWLLCLSGVAGGQSLQLADHGQTSYVIVAGGQNGDVDKMAIAELETFLIESTGVSFPSISGDAPQALSRKQRIVVGNSPVAHAFWARTSLPA